MSRYPLVGHLLVSVSVCLITAALAGGCSDNTQATPRITFEGSISPGRHTDPKLGDICTAQFSPWFTIGSFGNPGLGHKDGKLDGPLVDPVRPVDDGADEQQGKASVSCSVIAGGDGFDIALHAELTGATGGAMTMSGHIKADKGQTSPGVSLALTRKGETYSANAQCNVTFDTAQGHDIAAGRVWALIDCPDAAAPSAQRICETKAHFRFENCSQ